MLFMIRSTHPPSDCPTSNSKSREAAKRLGQELPTWLNKLGVKPVASPFVGVWNHESYIIVDAPGAKEVQELTTNAGLMQWNTVEIIPLVTMEEALKITDRLTPLH